MQLVAFFSQQQRRANTTDARTYYSYSFAHDGRKGNGQKVIGQKVIGHWEGVYSPSFIVAGGYSKRYQSVSHCSLGGRFSMLYWAFPID